MCGDECENVSPVLRYPGYSPPLLILLLYYIYKLSVGNTTTDCGV